MTSLVPHLPDEIYTSILSHLPATTLLSTTLACHKFNTLARDNSLWHRLYHSSVQSPSTSESSGPENVPLPDLHPEINYLQQYKFRHAPLRPIQFHHLAPYNANSVIWSIAYGEQNNVLAAVDNDEQIQIWRKAEDGFHALRVTDLNESLGSGRCNAASRGDVARDRAMLASAFKNSVITSATIKLDSENKSMIYSYRNYLQVRDLETSHITHSILSHAGPICAITELDSSGRLIATGSVKLFDLRSSTQTGPLATFDQEGTVLALSTLHNDGILVAGGRYHNLTMMDIRERKIVRVQFTGTDTRAMTTTGSHLHVLTSPSRLPGRLNTYTFSPSYTSSTQPPLQLHHITSLPIAPSALSPPSQTAPFVAGTLTGGVSILSPALRSSSGRTGGGVEYETGRVIVPPRAQGVFSDPVLCVAGVKDGVVAGGVGGVRAWEVGKAKDEDVEESGGEEMEDEEEGSGLLDRLRVMSQPFFG
ncbi:hypothetical protein HDV00_012115 [Rhizophlyctis rosea]|nr:hypothetical protein HDV00_012115 [Rhizophlyctis rosea]